MIYRQWRQSSAHRRRQSLYFAVASEMLICYFVGNNAQMRRIEIYTKCIIAARPRRRIMMSSGTGSSISLASPVIGGPNLN